MPKVALISVFYNRKEYVDRTIRSITQQDFNDVISYIIDDGSTDGTEAAIERYISGKVQLVAQSNCGFTNSLINAIAHTDSEYIAILGSGDVADPRRISAQVEYLDQSVDTAVVGVRYNLVDAARGWSTVSPESLGVNPSERLLTESIYGHSEVMFRRSFYERAGGYRSYFLMSQDNDLWLRMGELGKLGLIPQVLQTTYKLPNAVTVDPKRLLQARLYRDFAVHCAIQRRAGRGDPLVTFGPGAALLRPRSSNLAMRLTQDAKKLASRGDIDGAKLFIERALSEGMSLEAYLVSALCRSPTIAGLTLRAAKAFKVSSRRLLSGKSTT